jgi:hypothetical protein
VSTEDSIPDSNLHVFLVFPMFSRFPKFFLQNQMLQPSFRCFFFGTLHNSRTTLQLQRQLQLQLEQLHYTPN